MQVKTTCYNIKINLMGNLNLYHHKLEDLLCQQFNLELDRARVVLRFGQVMVAGPAALAALDAQQLGQRVQPRH